MAESDPKVIQFSENEFNAFQTKIKTEWIESGFIDDYYSDDLDNYSDNAETYNNEEMTNTYTSEPMSSIATTLNKSENINDTRFNTKEINISGSNSQELENSNLIVNSNHIKKMNTNQSDGDSISKREILLTSKLPLSTQILKMNHNCSELCAWCEKGFAVLDNPHHIGCLRNIETRNIFLKIESSLDILSCICDRCWNFLRKTHHLQKAMKKTQTHIPHVLNNVTKVNVDNLDSVIGGFGTENAANVNEVDKELRTENLDRDDERAEVNNTAIVDERIEVENTAGVNKGSEVDNKTEVNEGFGLDNTVNKSVKQNRHSKKKKSKKRKRQPAVTCSVHNCFKYSVHPISSDEFKRINQIICQFDFHNIILVQSKRKKSILLGLPPLSLCEEHLDMINVLTTCQLCGNKLNGYLDSKEWKMHDEWNEILKCNNIPLILKPGMFICTSCQNCVSKCNTLSPNILEDFRQIVKKRNDMCTKSFGCTPQVNIPNIYEESNVDALNDAFNKFDSPTKIKFSEPLTTSTYYFKPYNSEHNSTKSEGKQNKCHNHKSLEFRVPKIKSTENTILNCDYNRDPCILKIKSSDEEVNSVTADSLLSDVQKKHSKMSKSNYYRKKMLIKRTNKMMNLLKISHEPSDDKLLKNKDSLTKPTGGTENTILNDNSNNSTENKSTPIRNVAAENQIVNKFTKNKSTEIQNVAAENQIVINCIKNKSTPIKNVISEMDANKDLLPLHVCSLLDNNESGMSIHAETNKNQSIPINVNSNSMVHKNKLGETKYVKTEKTHTFFPVNTNIHPSQNVINIKNKESNQNSSELTTEYSYHYVYHQDENSSDLNEYNLNNIANNVVIVKPNEFDQRFCSLNSKNQHRMKPINRSELKKKLRNVIYQRISNGGIKKQKLNNTDDKNNIVRHLNAPTISTLFPRINEDGDSNKNEIIDLLSDEDEGLSIQIDKCYSLDPHYSKPLQCKRTLQKVDDYYSSTISAMRNSSANKILSEDSQKYGILDHDNSLNNQSNLNTTHSLSISEIDSQNTEFAQQNITINSLNNQSNLNTTHSLSISEIDSQNTEFAQQNITTNEEIEDLTQSDCDQSDSDNDENVIDIELDESNRHIYEHLKTRFNNNSSDIAMYLMNNLQMLYNGELVLSENASTHATQSINYHLNYVYQSHGDPTMNNTTSVSFLPDSSEHIIDSTLNNITTTTSATHTPIMTSKLNYSSTNSEITIISDDEESDT